MRRFSMLAILLALTLSVSVCVAQGYQNPIIPGYHPDPSVCRVGEDYYLVNSSFEFFPGVPVYHSRDLVHWEQIGHCLTRASQLPLEKCWASGGIFAPVIRYHQGTFYMITTNVSGGGNFIVHTQDPAGEWSEPALIDQPGIDPSIYFEDGVCYMTGTSSNKIYLRELDPMTGRLLTPEKMIWQGTGGRYPEGPHIYKKDGWYYLLIAEGGTEYGHKVTIARSRTIDGPYMSNPANPILTHIDMNAQSSPIQGLGHADFVQAHDGSWWVVCLGFRPQTGSHHVLGRETFLAPVRWDTGAWPVVNGDGTISLDMQVPTLPLVPVETPPVCTTFDAASLGFEWNYLRNPHLDYYALNARPGFLRLYASPITLDQVDSPTFVGRRQQHVTFEASTQVSLAGNAPSATEAGLTVYRDYQAHYDLFVQKVSGKRQLILRYRMGAVTHIESQITLPKGTVYLKVNGNNDYYTFSYSTDGTTFTSLESVNVRYLSSETNGGFTGVYIGLFAANPNLASTVQPPHAAYADFDAFWYEGQ